MSPPRFIEHRSERLNMLLRGADHPPPPPPETVSSLEAGLYVTVLIYGGVELQCGDTISTPRSNGMLVFAVREEVSWAAHGQANHLRAVGATMYRPDLRARGLETWFDGLFLGQEKLRQIQVAADPRSIRLVEEVLRADPADPLDVLRIEAAAQDIFLRGVALLDDIGEPSRRDRLMHLAEMLEADLGHDWTLPEMARLAGLSARSLTGRFGREFGATPFDWLRQRRLLRGRDMVVGEGASIAAVAGELGFSSPAHFSTAFRLMFGEAPSRARRAAERITARSSAVI